MRKSKADMAEVFIQIISIIVVSGIIWFVGGRYIQSWQIRRMTQSLTLKFPVGTDFSAAKAAVESAYPGNSTTYTASDCEKWSHMTSPAYIFKGGPCIFGMADANSWLYPVEAEVMFKLIFGRDNRLDRLYSDPVYTFL
jgi:hypothetical protein